MECNATVSVGVNTCRLKKLEKGIKLYHAFGPHPKRCDVSVETVFVHADRYVFPRNNKSTSIGGQQGDGLFDSSQPCR